MNVIVRRELNQDFTVPCDAVIRYCANRLSVENCCATATMLLTPLGQCYRIPGINQDSSGFGYGLSIALYPPNDKARVASAYNILHNEGIGLKLAEQKKGLTYDVTFVPPGVHALVPLRAVKFEFMNTSPNYECLTHVSEEYSEEMCFDDCIFKAGVEPCKCR